MSKKGITIQFPEHVKKRLEEMSEEVGIPQNQLVNLATISMLENYKQKGSFIFVDLLNPDHKSNNTTRTSK
jgi:hypothetical protein